MKIAIGSVSLLFLTACVWMPGHPERSDPAAEAGAEVGMLRCERVPGTGLNAIVYSETDIACVFESSDGKTERYKGSTGMGLGLDLNVNRQEKFAYTVVSAAPDVRPGSHSLAGNYAGPRAGLSLARGGGASLMMGGGRNSVALQPVGWETTEGFGLIVGIGHLELTPDTAPN